MNLSMYLSMYLSMNFVLELSLRLSGVELRSKFILKFAHFFALFPKIILHS